jgi:hypothetical protein
MSTPDEKFDFWGVIDGPEDPDPSITPHHNQHSALAEYGKALQEFFPQGSPFVGMVQGSSIPLACTILGSHVISISQHHSGAWNATWQQVVGTHPVPAINWAQPHQGPKSPPMATMARRPFKSPTEFRMWLNYVASKALQTAKKQLLDAMHTDNWMLDQRLATQACIDIHLLGATEDMICDDAPPLPWKPTAKPNTYGVSVLAKGTPAGSLGLGFRQGCWVYGAAIGDLTYKLKTPVTLGLADLAQAKKRAERLHVLKTYEWLLTHAAAPLFPQVPSQ